MTYEVVWDGSHRGCDADLLFAGIRGAVKRAAPQVKRERITSGWTVAATLPVDPRLALTFHDLVRATGYSSTQVNNALYGLRRRGELRSAPIPGARPRRGRPPLLYWKATA